MKLDAVEPWTQDVNEAWLVKADSKGHTYKVSFAELVPAAPVDGCATTFAGDALPWPPDPGAKAPLAPCGSQRPGLNAAPGVGLDGSIYVISRAHFNAAYSYLVAVNANLSLKWSASLRDRLDDGCDVLLPPSGELGGCRAGSLRGVDPATNEMPAGMVEDQSTASPVIAPDGSVLYGAFTRYNYSRGHLFRFSSAGEFMSAYPFGWDVTPAIYEHDGTWSAVIKENHYGGVVHPTPAYFITQLSPSFTVEWQTRNTTTVACGRAPDGSVGCVPAQPEGFEWCVN